MGWYEAMQDLEDKVIKTLEGKFTPMDGIPFFRVQYPPKEEREAIRQFRLLKDRLEQRGWKTLWIPVTEMMKEALASLVNCPLGQLSENLKKLERERNRKELSASLSEHLPPKLTETIVRLIKRESLGRKGVLFLVRTGTLYPFIRPSTLLAQLENRVESVVVFAYPGTSLGMFLDACPSDPHGGYYRGEVISWR